ncbi:hypothetical protein ACHRV5_10635 [Flavobacterium sp. FlaQc-52]|jgi:hypothetical protein|uniref:hypothetical protein n=1 Tax=Flavobacterium sp. FlaQc-52 TaxID=3374185 RepID=UPI003757F7CC
MNIINLYTGYEGYAELVLKEKNDKNQIIFEVHLLDFHFYEILSLIPLGQYDRESVMYNYFQCKGWHEEEWEATKKEEFINQLNLIENKVPHNLLTIYNAIKQICSSSIQNKSKLFINLE